MSKNTRDSPVGALLPGEAVVLYGMILHGRKNATEEFRTHDVAKALRGFKSVLQGGTIQNNLDRLCHWYPSGHSPMLDGPHGPVRVLPEGLIYSRRYHLDQSKMLTNRVDALVCLKIKELFGENAVPMTTLNKSCSKSLRLGSDEVESSVLRLLQKRYLTVFYEACPLISPTFRIDEEISLIDLLAKQDGE